MSRPHLLHALTSQSTRSAQRRRNRKLTAQIERLEARTLLAAVLWDGGAGTLNWDDKANWSGDELPVAADDVSLNIAGPTVTISVAGNPSIKSLSTSENLVVTDSLRINSHLDWNGGTIAGSGTTTLAADATATLTSGGLDGHTFENLGDVTWGSSIASLGFSFAHGATWNNHGSLVIDSLATHNVIVASSQGDGNEAINNFGDIVHANSNPTASSATVAFNNVALNNHGTVDVQSGQLWLAGGGTSTSGFQVAQDARLTFFGSHTLQATSPSQPSITGAGEVTLFAGTTTVAGLYDVTGKTTIAAGNFSFSGRVDSVGETLAVDSGVADFGNSDLTVSHLSLGGTLISGGVQIDNHLDWNGGTLSGSGTTTLGSSVANATGTLTGGGLDGHTFENLGDVTWGSTITTANLAFAHGAIWNNHGSLTIDSLATHNASVPTSQGDGNEAINNFGQIVHVNSSPTASSSTVAVTNIALNNHGTVDVQSGQLWLAGGGTSTSGFQVAQDARLTFFGSHTLQATSPSQPSITGAGEVTLFAGTTTIAGLYDVTGKTTIAAGNFSFSGRVDSVGETLAVDSGVADFGNSDLTVSHLSLGGTLISGGVQIDNHLDWIGGTFAGSGTTTLGSPVANATGTLTSGGLDGHTFENFGDVTWSQFAGTFKFAHGGTWNNHGSLVIDSTDSLRMFVQQSQGDGSEALNNFGQLIQSKLDPAAPAAATRIDNIALINHNTVDVQSGQLFLHNFQQIAGEARLGGGMFSGNLNIHGGRVTGVGEINGSIHNGGEMDPGNDTGIINISGKYFQESAGVLSIDVGGTTVGSEYDQLDVDGTVTLGGDLHVDAIGGFTPIVGALFTIIDNDGSDAVDGTFDGLEEGAIVDGGSIFFEISYVGGPEIAGGPGNDVVLTVVEPFIDVSGRVFDDANNDGSDDMGDAGLAGLTMTLAGSDGQGPVNRTTSTLADGSYLFEDVLPGTYSITAEQPANLLDGKETAGNLGGIVDNTQDSNVITNIVIGTTGVDAEGYNFANIQPSDLLGIVWEDFNNDGEVNFGEQAVADVDISLSGIDDRGNTVGRPTVTDLDGVYMYVDLRPGEYAVSETQPAGLEDGLDVLGTVNGVVAGDNSVNDVLSEIVISQPGSIAENYNFGERPAAGGEVVAGQTATIGFWQNKNGQALLESLNGGSEATQLSSWLAATFVNIYGDDGDATVNPNDLTGMTNVAVADFYSDLFRRKKKEATQLGLSGPTKMDAQVLAVAFATYVTNQTLAGTTASDYGFIVTANGVGISTFNVGDAGAAFNVADDSELTVLDFLLATNAQSTNGVLYDVDGDGDADDNLETVLRTLANDVFSTINEAGDI